MKTKRQLSSQALAAKQIRVELKNAFPTVKFTVRSDCFAGGDSVHINWENGASYKMVNDIVSKYQYGHFNSMEDIYEYSKPREDISQSKYVTIQRDISVNIIEYYFREFQKTYSGWKDIKDVNESSVEFLNNWSNWTPREYILRKLSDIDLTNHNQ